MVKTERLIVIVECLCLPPPPIRELNMYSGRLVQITNVQGLGAFWCSMLEFQTVLQIQTSILKKTPSTTFSDNSLFL